MTTLITLLLCTVLATGHTYPCTVGRGGVNTVKQEGDGITPAGSFPLRRVFYRSDRLTKTELSVLNGLKQRGFSVQALTPDDGWCDDTHSPYYNQYIKLSTFDTKKTPHHENLWRDDDHYDILVVLGYNDNPVVNNQGSAIFMHIADLTQDDKYKPTAGCVAFSKPDLLQILQSATLASRLIVPLYGTITMQY